MKCPSMLSRFIDVENHADATTRIVMRTYNEGVRTLYAKDVAYADCLPESEQGKQESQQ